MFAIFCRPNCEVAVNLIKGFVADGMPISTIILEVGERRKIPDTLEQFKAAHAAFAEQFWRTRPFLHRFQRYCQRIRIGVERRIRAALGISSQCSIVNLANKFGLRLVTVQRHSCAESVEAVTTAYSRWGLICSTQGLIKAPLLDITSFDILNIHPGYLPRHRGLDSLPWSILEEDRVGMSVHIVDEGVDTGPVLGFFEFDFVDGDTLLNLRKRCAESKIEIFRRIAPSLLNGEAKFTPQRLEDGIHHRPMTVKELWATERKLQLRIKEGNGRT